MYTIVRNKMSNTNEQKEELIKAFAGLIEQAIQNGHIEIARLYKQELDTVLATAKLDGSIS